MSLTSYINTYDVTSARPMANYFNRYGGQVPLIVGDHSTHTIDAWKGYKHNIRYNQSVPSERRDVDIVQYLTAPALVHALNPNTKLIVMMRNPVSRIFSLYKFHVRKDLEDFHNGVTNGIAWWSACVAEQNPLNECLYGKPELRTYQPTSPCTWNRQATASIRKSLYHYYVKEWLDTFPRQQFLMFRFEDYVSNSTHYLNSLVFPFLGLPRLGGFNKLSMRMRWDFRLDFLRYKQPNHERPSKLRFGSWRHGDMLPETKRLLREFYQPHNQRLAELLGSDRYLWT